MPAAIFTAVALAPTLERAPNNPAVQSDEEYGPEDYSDESVKARDAIYWSRHNGRAETYRAICDKPKHHDDADLCQQWETARAAKQQAKWALPQFVVSTLSLVGLVVAIVLSAFATRAANRAADAAFAQTDELKKEFIASHRPKIAFRLARANPHLPLPRFEVLILAANIGDSNASIVRLRARMFLILETGQVPPILDLEPQRVQDNTVIKCGNSNSWRMAASLTDQDVADYDSGAGQFYCAGVIRYRDDNGTARETAFCRRFDKASGRFVETGDTDHEYAT